MKAARPKTTPDALWILGASALAFVATPAFMLASVGPDRVRAVWLVAVIWVSAVSLVQALWKGIRHTDWSGFTCEALPPDDEQFDSGLCT